MISEDLIHGHLALSLQACRGQFIVAESRGSENGQHNNREVEGEKWFGSQRPLPGQVFNDPSSFAFILTTNGPTTQQHHEVIQGGT